MARPGIQHTARGERGEGKNTVNNGSLVRNRGCPSNSPAMQAFCQHLSSAQPDIVRGSPFVGDRLSWVAVVVVIGGTIDAIFADVPIMSSFLDFPEIRNVRTDLCVGEKGWEYHSGLRFAAPCRYSRLRPDPCKETPFHNAPGRTTFGGFSGTIHAQSRAVFGPPRGSTRPNWSTDSIQGRNQRP